MNGANQTQQGQQQNQQQQQQDQGSKKIELDEETYAALLDKIDELETSVKGKGKQTQVDDEDEDDLDALAREGKQGKGGQQDIDLDQLSPKQLHALLRQDISMNVVGPMMVSLYELKYTMEMDKLMRPKEMGGNGFTDLEDYKEEIKTLMIENPKMSMKRAYTLAKAENPEKSKTTKAKSGDEGERETRLRHLPPHPRKGSFGERPGSAESSTAEGEPKSLQDAASKAFDQVMKGRNQGE